MSPKTRRRKQLGIQAAKLIKMTRIREISILTLFLTGLLLWIPSLDAADTPQPLAKGRRFALSSSNYAGPASGHTTLDTLNEIARVHYNAGEYRQSEIYRTKALLLEEQVYGKDHPVVAASLNILADLYQKQHRHEDAELLLERAIGIMARSSGPDHPNVAVSLGLLAECYLAQGEFQDAERLYARILKIFEAAYGADDPRIVTVKNQLVMRQRALRNRVAVSPQAATLTQRLGSK
ncbi:MAG: tetratricopeptide repeat protein [Candidatus Omnitrophica bacterium]|nr:tetratricopeptide repeat protein [Candidatus Omnitrophota bacterium]